VNETNVLLVVSDPPSGADLANCLNDTPGIRLHTAKSADEGMSVLQGSSDRFDLLILDSHMRDPASKGMLERIKGDRRLAVIPIVLLTPAQPTANQLRDGAASGAYHFLVMPARHDKILAVVHAALVKSSFRNFLRRQMGAQAERPELLSNCEFSIRTLEEAGELAALIAQACPNPDAALFGISELLVNGVEHGNLGLTYEEKSRLALADQWKSEIDRRCALPDNLSKRVRLSFRRTKDRITLRISDDGQGFAWQKYLELEPQRACDPNGRGIALARLLSFSSIHYEGCGNVAVATIGPDSDQP
jgi:CheY-like chemotaxis protein